MSRSFEILTESPASVEEIHAAFDREDYWLARIAAGEATTTTLDSLLVDADGTAHERGGIALRVSRRCLRFTSVAVDVSGNQSMPQRM